MDEFFSCEECSCEYESSKAIPKLLECGHTFCLPCTTEIAQNSRICPKCLKPISNDVKSFPTNLILLRIVEAYKSIKNFDSHVVCSVEMIKNKYLQRKDTLSKKRLEIASSLEVIENGLAKLDELTESDSPEIDKRKTNKILTKLEEDYKQSEDLIRFNYWKVNLAVSISLGSFKSPENYWTEIYQRLKIDENIYAVQQIEDQLKYGEVYVYDNKLLFHSLTLTEVPPRSRLVWFEELKQCLSSSSKNFYTFFEICCNKNFVTRTVILEMFDRHSRNQFIKLCTSECGPTYKFCSYNRGFSTNKDYLQTFLHVGKFNKNGYERDRMIEYSYCGDKTESYNFEFQKDEMYVFLNPDFSFKIDRVKYNFETSNFPFGKVIYPPKLYDSIKYEDVSSLKIVDCGIVFDI